MQSAAASGLSTIRIPRGIRRAVGVVLACTIGAMLNVAANAQSGPGDYKMTPIPAPAQTGAIPLYQAAPPGNEGAARQEIWAEVFDGRVVRNVTHPTLTPYLPKPEIATGAGVIVAPGGGFMLLSIDNEGEDVARWLADHGVAAFVLKYRLNASPVDDAEFGKAMASMGARPPAKPGETSPPRPAGNALAFDDAQQAIRLVQSRAKEWGVDPDRLGMIGFSAGAMTTLQAALRNDAQARPDFIGLIYGSLREVDPPANPPALFAAGAMDDPLLSQSDFGILDAWKRAGGRVEFHLYEEGGHGFGMRQQATTSDLWAEQFLAWMKSGGLLKKGD